MKNVKKMIIRLGTSLASFAFMLNVVALNPYCHFFFHEPELPAQLKEMRRR